MSRSCPGLPSPPAKECHPVVIAASHLKRLCLHLCLRSQAVLSTFLLSSTLVHLGGISLLSAKEVESPYLTEKHRTKTRLILLAICYISRMPKASSWQIRSKIRLLSINISSRGRLKSTLQTHVSLSLSLDNALDIHNGCWY